MIRISAKEARAKFSWLLDQVEKGEEVVVLRRGQEAVKMIPAVHDERTKTLPSLEEFRKKIKVKGEPLSETVIKERDDSRF